ncbi:MAG: hypothetical protein ACMG6H_13610, partial [Acidobacteriota bacterium]
GVTGLAQEEPKPKRLRIPRGKHSVVTRGLVGGEATDYYLVRARAGQKLTVRATSPLKHTQVNVSPEADDVHFANEPERSDLTRWTGTAPRTGDYLISVNVYPGGEHYTLRISVR